MISKMIKGAMPTVVGLASIGIAIVVYTIASDSAQASHQDSNVTSSGAARIGLPVGPGIAQTQSSAYTVEREDQQ